VTGLKASAGRGARVGAVAPLAGVAVALGLSVLLHYEALVRTPVFMSMLARDSVHTLGRTALAIELEDDPALMAVRGGPLELRRDDIARILDTAFGEADFMAEAARVHTGIIGLLRRFPRDSVLRLSIGSARPSLVTSTAIHVRRRMEALPGCSFGQDAAVLLKGLRQKLFGDRDDDEFAASLPDCRPPGPVERAVVRGVNRKLVDFAANGPDSVTLVHVAPGDSAFTRWARAAHRTGALVEGPAIFALAGLLVLVGALIRQAPPDSRASTAWRAIAGAGITLLALGTIVRFRADAIQAATRIPIPGGAGAGEADRAWLNLAAYALRAAVRGTARFEIITGLGLLVTALAGAAFRIRPAAGPARTRAAALRATRR